MHNVDYKQRIDELQPEIIKSVSELVQIPSVINEGEGGTLFGLEIDRALRFMLDMCEKFGFKTFYNPQGYYGWAEIGDAEEMTAVLVHIDVVPAGDPNTWKYPPFGGTVAEGKIFGRGVHDNKAPAISCLYAAKALLDCGYKLNKRFRIIFGTDEESKWRCMNEYGKHEEIPGCGFAPDAKFPMINAEKLLLQLTLVSDEPSDVDVSGGTAFNVVCDKAAYRGDMADALTAELDKLNYKYECVEDKVSVIGKSAHASTPNEGLNAIGLLCAGLAKAGAKANLVRFIGEVIGETCNCENFAPLEDEVSGKITLNVGVIKADADGQEACLDFRSPVTFKKQEVIEPLTKIAAEYGLKVVEFDCQEALYLQADNFLIKALRKVYEEETGLDSTPLSNGGATYARTIPNCVAFGPSFPGDVKIEHQANEYFKIDHLMRVTKIYASAIKELTQATI